MKLFIVINQTNHQFTFSNTECKADTQVIQAYASTNLPSVNLTHGQHNEGCDIPECSAKGYYDEHHMTFTRDDASSFTFWHNDDTNEFYYSTGGGFDKAPVIPGDATNSDSKKAIYIMNDGTLQITDIHK
ncbi:hypothetical protein SAMN04487969_11252 [Paenibacillus algorifonticola]|uniref:Uncharacterized protein n=1 Tax=Paenibacillus algorifonticola TaxID=684063 RepID=A0A1I2FII6_9BACL|nr:hypothetical protein [Paenibacillus algorifonticola]SFF04326.1 hypothetical protein SAMN04487969_11252 [Paenibacillus algorifonticola]